MAENLFTFSFKAAAFTLMLIPLIYFGGNKYKTASTENQINTYNQKRWEEFYSLDDNSLDMVFVGSSHSYCTFDPLIFDEKLGISSYQMGMPLQHPDSTYYTLREILNHHIPKTVVMEVYWDMFDDDFELNQIKSLFQVMKNEELKNEFQAAFPIGEGIKYNVNVLKYQDDYFAYKNSEWQKKCQDKWSVSLPTAEKQQGIEEYRSRGYTFCNYNMLRDEFDKTNQFRGLDGRNYSMSKVQLNYLQKIIDLCSEKNIRLVFVTAPIALVSMDYIENYDMIHDKFQAIADKNNIAYYDYNLINKEENLLTNENFRDDAHLNDSGVRIISENFADKIKDRG